jgi:hypothetical protein
MALSRDDWREMLAHIRTQVREVGLADIDDRIAGDIRASVDSRDDFSRYLAMLLRALNEQSYSGYKRALRAIRESIRTEEGGPIEGIEILVTEADANLYQTRRIDLEELTDLAPVISDLAELYTNLKRAGEFDG